MLLGVGTRRRYLEVAEEGTLTIDRIRRFWAKTYPGDMVYYPQGGFS